MTFRLGACFCFVLLFTVDGKKFQLYESASNQDELKLGPVGEPEFERVSFQPEQRERTDGESPYTGRHDDAASHPEESNNFLGGSKTPMFLAKRNSGAGGWPVSYSRVRMPAPGGYEDPIPKRNPRDVGKRRLPEKLPSSGLPITVYPEILIAVDYDTFEKHDKNLTALALYMLAFWNAVEMRFRELESPRVRLNIAGIVVPEDERSAPYMESETSNRTHVWDADTAIALGSFFAKYSPIDHDVVFGFSSRTILEKQSSDDMNGIAFVGGACDFENSKAAGLVKHSAGFQFTTTAAHELGHLLGARHDEFGDKSCGDHHGYMMSPGRWGLKGLHWSNCSVRAIRNFTSKREAECLRNRPDVGRAYGKILPGKLLTRDQQCQKLMGMLSYKKHEHNCTALYCATYFRKDWVKTFDLTLKPPAEGSYCGQGKICLDGNCVLDEED